MWEVVTVLFANRSRGFQNPKHIKHNFTQKATSAILVTKLMLMIGSRVSILQQHFAMYRGACPAAQSGHSIKEREAHFPVRGVSSYEHRARSSSLGADEMAGMLQRSTQQISSFLASCADLAV